jgi:hypothetical protein
VHVEHLLAPLDHRAEEVTDRDRGHLMHRDRHHRLVQQGHARRDRTAIDQAPALTDPSQGDEFPVAETITRHGCFGKAHVGSLDVAFEHRTERSAIAHVPLLDTIQVTVIEQALRPVDPPTARNQFTLVQENESHPEGATGGPGDIIGAQIVMMCTPPCVEAVIHPANEVASHGDPLQILRLQTGVRLRGRQLCERVPPRPPTKGLTTSTNRVSHGHSLVHSAFCFIADHNHTRDLRRARPRAIDRGRHSPTGGGR